MFTDPPVAVLNTTPDVELMEATEGLLLDHAPPEGVQLSVAVDEGHKLAGPAMVPGVGVTVTVEVKAL